MLSETKISDNWNALYENYKNDMLSKVKQTSLLNSYFRLGYGLPFEYIIDVRNKDIFKNKVYLDLLEQLGVDGSKITDDTDFIFIKSGTSIVLSNFRENGRVEDTPLGKISFFCGEEGDFEIYLEDKEYVILPNDDYDMKIVILHDGNLFDKVSVKYSVDETFSVYQIEFQSE